MDQNMITLLIAVVALLISLYCFYAIITLRKKQPAPPEADGFTARPLQLQAYERLVMLAERISIPSIIGRANQQQGLNARQMQILLIESIKQEFEYNATQQIYVSPAAWGAIKNLKDQNQLIINQIGSAMPPEASGTDLNRTLLEYTMTQSKGTLHEIVLEALNYEAKKIMR